jgi:dihydropteroate synthase
VIFPRRPFVIGVVNVTPDSFSDGGQFADPDAAVAHALDLVGQGAGMLDVGGESTRPGARPVEPGEEQGRVIGVVERLRAARVPVPISIDTRNASTASAAIAAGASIVNDVSAGRHDPAMLRVVAEAGAGLLLMHMRGEPATMQDDPRYDDVTVEVTRFLLERLGAAEAAGIAPGALAVDPGLGFGKTTAHNLTLLARLPELVAVLGVPVVIGASRKGFIGRVLAGEGADPLPVDQREDGTLATVVWALDQGATAVRVHDVRAAARALQVLDIMQRAYDGGLQDREDAA